MKFTIGVMSDDIVTYDFGDDSEEIGTAEMDFVVTLPGGQVLPVRVDYGMHGWEFSVDLPEGSVVQAIPPPED